jgi:hypothetical protein
VEYWNELPLPTGGRLRDVLDAPDRASVAHVEIPHEALTALACVYGSQPDPARRLLQGALADTLVGIAQAPVFLWLDDSHVEVLSKQTVTRDRYLRRTWDRDEWGAYEAAAIAKGLDRVVTLAKELRRSAS